VKTLCRLTPIVLNLNTSWIRKNQSLQVSLFNQGFVVAHEMRISVKESTLFGKLIDDILKQGVNKINSLEWKPF